MSQKKAKPSIRIAKQERAQSTVEAILKAATRVLISEGYERASTNRIAEIAGVSIGSLYQYFPDKEAIVADLIERKLIAEMGVFSQAMDRAEKEPLATGTRTIIRAMIESTASHVRLRRVYHEQIPKVGKLGRLRELQRLAAERVASYLGSRSSEIVVSVEDLPLAAYVAVHAVEGLIHISLAENPELLENGRLERELVNLVMLYLTGRRSAFSRPSAS